MHPLDSSPISLEHQKMPENNIMDQHAVLHRTPQWIQCTVDVVVGGATTIVSHQGGTKRGIKLHGKLFNGIKRFIHGRIQVPVLFKTMDASYKMVQIAEMTRMTERLRFQNETKRTKNSLLLIGG
ncbi:hypothetical protein Nepgr_027282 [Nepenthes gracilis]|uniref:Uncharacterized protein n=1 Tax=Nepenthes gracilis TaxID=150966 RepID=A0AAD3Y2Y6_NEPGR|nr:hypothetical protein Nepgr_027282 [Nepenthes gracilis]